MHNLKDIRKKGTFTLYAANLEETHAMGVELGLKLAAKTIISLKGELGSGKTSFVQGLAKGMNVPAEYYVTSPTYNIINEYPGKFILYHIDLYRISDPDDLYDIGFEEIIEDDQGIIAIEWPDKIPEGRINADIEINIEILKDDSRSFSFTIL